MIISGDVRGVGRGRERGIGRLERSGVSCEEKRRRKGEKGGGEGGEEIGIMRMRWVDISAMGHRKEVQQNVFISISP